MTTAIDEQGVIGIQGSKLYSIETKTLVNISNIRINNTQDTNYNVSLYRYTRLTNKKILLYSFELTAGDIVNDSTIYQLNQGDYLFATASLTTINYVISGNEFPI